MEDTGFLVSGRGSPLFWFTILAVLNLWIQKSFAIPIDNGVIGQPRIECGVDSITMSIVTRNEFEGNIFAKGHFSQSECRSQGVPGGVTDITFRLSLTQTACGVRRIRESNPRGMAIEATVVVSFHPLFITKVDRAYRLSCFYMEADKTATYALDVSMITTVGLTGTVTMPICKYQILQGGINGPPVRYAKIGDPVYHKWTCETQQPDLFCMRIHTCTVDDGSAVDNPVPVIDSQGCATDRYILQNLDYLTDLMAGQEAHVFKFADKPLLYFNCKIEIKVKEGSCSTLTPRCPSLKFARRRRRRIPGNSTESLMAEYLALVMEDDAKHLEDGAYNYDLEPQQLIVLDIDERAPDDPTISSAQDRLANEANNGYVGSTEVHYSRGFCLSPTYFALFLASLGILGALIIVVILGVASRCRTASASSDKGSSHTGRSDQRREERRYGCCSGLKNFCKALESADF